MYYTYVLISDKNNKYYIGSTYSIERRLQEHNNGKVKFTSLYKPWSIYYFEEFDDRSGAIKRERQIKTWKSRNMIEKLKFKQSRGSSIHDKVGIGRQGL